MENSNTLYSGVMIPCFVLTAKMIVLNGSCLLVVSRAAPVIHRLQPHRDAPPVQAGIAARVTNGVISGSSSKCLGDDPLFSIGRFMCFASVSDMMLIALLKIAH